MANTIQINIHADPNILDPTLSLVDVPWYAGITVLQAMIIGEAMHVGNFLFQVKYRSIYGAQIDGIDGVTDLDIADHYWMLWINGQPSTFGASEAVLIEDITTKTALVEWRFADAGTVSSSLIEAKLKPL